MPTINTDSAQYLDFVVRKGDTFEKSLTNVLIDGVAITSSYTASIKIRASESASPVLEWETTNEITITSGTIAIVATAASMAVASGVYYYDLQITYPDTTVHTWLWGKFIINPTFT